MFSHYISISFLGILLIPIFILFLIFIQSIGEGMRKTTSSARQEAPYYKTKADKETYPQRLQRIK